MSLGHTLLVLAIYVLAVATITRLINYDVILDPLRLWIARRASAAHEAAGEAEMNGAPTMAIAATRRHRRWNVLSDFLACPWCVGMWIALFTAPAVIHVLAWPLWSWVPVALAARHLVGIGDRWVSDPFTITEG